MSQMVHDDHQWLLEVQEQILEPDRPIIDPHHHLWRRRRSTDYLLDDLWEDTGSGHNIRKTVFIECHAGYRREGPEHLRPVGETEFVADLARQSRAGGPQKAEIAGIVAYADLRLKELDQVLEAHEEAAEGLFKGIRQAGAHEGEEDYLFIKPRESAGLYLDPDFQRGLARLGRLGLSYDTWHYHHQNRDFLKLAQAVPDTLIVLDHFGTPLGVGPYANRKEEIYRQWRDDIAAIARCENVVAKLGGLAMPDNGFGWNLRDRPPTSDEFVEAQKRYYLHTIDCFGPERCMFESNFPVDKWSLSYHVVWNGFKKMVADFSADEKSQLFHDTASRVYRL
ncbi:amidohydrolase family protein [Gilvimarinus sp. F26214L]|uniref:amidohydrolase family protein n=1 Tax=Gilvimarinus sp. DZF01 TaxID=3461371 RepID=UPI00404600CA